MRIHHRVLYLPVSAGIEKPQNWWTAWNITMAVKNGSLKGYFEYISDDGKRARVDKSNAKQARFLFCRWMLSKAMFEVGHEKFDITSVPSSDAVVGDVDPSRSMSVLTDGLPKCEHNRIFETLRFTEKLAKASQGGPRFADELYPKMTVIGDVRGKTVVLVDDVMTSGGHMKASRAKLAEAGANVVCGVVCGRTVNTTNLDPLEEGVIEISDNLGRVDDLDFS